MPLYQYECPDCNRMIDSIESLDTLKIDRVCVCTGTVHKYIRNDYPEANIVILGKGLTPRFHR